MKEVLEELREELYIEIIQSDYKMLDRNVIKISEEMDRMINSYMVNKY